MKRTKNLLLVEDDQAVRDSLEKAMTLENYNVVSAENTRDALSRFKDHPIDIALLDLNLGVDDGWETFERLTQLQPFLPIIVMSAQDERLAHPSAQQARACLHKPLDLPELFQTLEEHCPLSNK